MKTTHIFLETLVDFRLILLSRVRTILLKWSLLRRYLSCRLVKETVECWTQLMTWTLIGSFECGTIWLLDLSILFFQKWRIFLEIILGLIEIKIFETLGKLFYLRLLPVWLKCRIQLIIDLRPSFYFLEQWFSIMGILNCRQLRNRKHLIIIERIAASFPWWSECRKRVGLIDEWFPSQFESRASFAWWGNYEKWISWVFADFLSFRSKLILLLVSKLWL